MSVLTWDTAGSRVYETGLDRGVLYLSNGSAVPWNGLIEVSEKFDKDVESVYYDGMKISDLVSLGDFSATLKAITYPDEFIELDGYGFLRQGMYIGNQNPQTFSLSYRTQVGNDIDGNVAGYKIHILYNLTAMPADRTYSTVSDELNLAEFEWDISSVPQEVAGFRPTAHIIFNTIDLEPDLLMYIEEKLYGSEHVDPSLMSISDLVSYMYTWALMEIIDNGDGTWTAIADNAADISYDAADNTLFTITNANATYRNTDAYDISNVINSSDVT